MALLSCPPTSYLITFLAELLRTRTIAEALVNADITQDVPELNNAVDWIAHEYHPNWIFGRALRKGIGIHHGRIPRALAQYVVKRFNEGQLRFLICTSSLIEGVNTSAKNIVVLDNRKYMRSLDYFTYKNICGRSGRMFKHFVGRVYLFFPPPEKEYPSVDIPIFTQPDNTPDELLIQLDDNDLSDSSKQKVDQYKNQKVIDVDILKKSHGVDPQAQLRIANMISNNVQRMSVPLTWKGIPQSYNQLETICNLIWVGFFNNDRRRRYGVSSGRQLAFRLNLLRQYRDISRLIEHEMQDKKISASEAVDNVLEFTRTWPTYLFPKLLMAIDRIQKHVFLQNGLEAGDYGPLAVQSENCFFPPPLIILEEYGVPIQTAFKISGYLNPQGDLDDVLNRLKILRIDELPISDFEKDLLSEAQRYL